MNKQKSQENSISYLIPIHANSEGNMTVPECHKLYVCPSACGRRFAIRALKHGDKDAVSFLYITETDAVSGHYEEMIGDAISDLLAEMACAPKAILIHVNCIDDFLGTDEQALLERLRIRFPFLHFTVCHVNPHTISEKSMPCMRIHSQVYGLLDYTGKKDKGINLIGHFEPIDAESELFSVLSGWRVNKVRQLFDRKTFEEFQQMADSSLTLVLTPNEQMAAENMKRKLDIPFFMNVMSYDVEEVLQSYHVIAEMLGEKCPDFDQEILQTRQAVEQAKVHVGNIPVIVDSSASHKPFTLAKALCSYGFNVQAVFYIHMEDNDLESRKWLEEYYPLVSIIRSQNYELIVNAGFRRNCIAIGFDCAYTIQADHFVDIIHNESFYGFHGVRKLMRLICKAYDTAADWEQIKEADKELQRL